MSDSYENVTNTCCAAGWCETGCDWAQTDIDTTMIGHDSGLADTTLQELYSYCSKAIRKLPERHEVVSEYAWDSDEDGSVVADDSEEVCSVYAWDADEICSEYAWEAEDPNDCDSEVDQTRCSWESGALGLESPIYCENECCVGSECQRYPASPVDNADFLDEDFEDDAPVDENQTEGESPFGFQMRFDKMEECRAMRSLHGHFSRIDYDNFEFSDLAGNKINVFFYYADLHAVQQNQTTWFNFECLPPAVANTLCAARTAINSTFNY